MEDDKILKGIIIKKRKFYLLDGGVTGKQKPMN